MLEIDLLGPVEVRASGKAVSLSPLERNLLAILALAKGTVVSTEKIIDCMWGDRHPVSPRSRVQGLVSSLRRKVGDALVTRHPGYLLDAAPSAVDIDKCQDLARQARLAKSPEDSAQWLRLALALWRGEPLDGVVAPGIDVDRVRLGELRMALLEERFAAELDAGNHAELVAELAATVSAHPLRERLAGQLMVALYRCNRQADALKAYQALRTRLADELGSDPCADLRNLHAAMLRGDPVYQSFTAVPAAELVAELRPAQLPASVGHFTGRDGDLAALTRAATRAGDEPHVIVVSGAGGLGKTALVVRWAHSISDRFPDGQIFVDLHGHEAERVPAQAALAVALAALGVARDNIPASVDERTALYRTLISGRRILIIADDAESVDQLLPLVPPTTVSQMVATSRRRLAGLAAHHDVRIFPIGPLRPEETHELLARIVGPQRLGDPAAARVVEWCGGWPLAIRLAATLLAARPGQSLASFADWLAEHADDQLLDDDPRSVRAALAEAYRSLSPAAAHLFGRLGLHAGTSVCLQQAAAAEDSSARRVRRLFDELVAVNLIVEAGPDRYRFHDIVRRFARQCGAEIVDRDVIDDWMRRRQATVPDAAAGDGWRIPIGSEVR